MLDTVPLIDRARATAPPGGGASPLPDGRVRLAYAVGDVEDVDGQTVVHGIVTETLCPDAQRMVESWRNLAQVADRARSRPPA